MRSTGPGLHGAAQRCTLGALVLSMLAGCSGSPSINVLGSFFPSWMLCAIGGLVLGAVTQRVLARFDIDQHLPARALTYLVLMAGFGFGIWLAWLS